MFDLWLQHRLVNSDNTDLFQTVVSADGNGRVVEGESERYYSSDDENDERNVL